MLVKSAIFVARSCVLFTIIFCFGLIDRLQAQVFISAHRYDYDHDTTYITGVLMDTSIEEFNSYTTSYKVFNSQETENRKPLFTILITHFPTDKSIELVVLSSKMTKRPDLSGDQPNTTYFRYRMICNMIVGNKNDTLPFDSTYKFYNIVYFFGDPEKKKYVYLNQISETYTQLPYNYFLSPIPLSVYKEDSIAHELFKLEGTFERRYANWLKENELFQRDSIRREDSIRAEFLNKFLQLRKDTFVIASLDTAMLNAVILKKKIQEVALNFRKGKMKFDGTFEVKTDTMGNILSVETKDVSTESHNYQLFSSQLADALEGNRVQMISRVFQSKLYPMQTQFDLQVYAFCDTLLQTVKKVRDSMEYGIQLYNDENVTRKLSDVFAERSRYSFVIYYSEIQGEKFYYITKLRGGGRNFGDMVFEEN